MIWVVYIGNEEMRIGCDYYNVKIQGSKGKICVGGAYLGDK